MKKASRQKNPEWLDAPKNQSDYERLLKLPFQEMALSLKTNLSRLAPGYHFPTRGIGRIKRARFRLQAESDSSQTSSGWDGNSPYKGFVTYTASRPTGSRFDHNPSLFFMLYPDDPDGDSVLLAGGLYFPSSKQARIIREAIASHASAFDELFSDRLFKKVFPKGFSLERPTARMPRGFDKAHPRAKWLALQGYYVWKSYSQKQFTSPRFFKTLCEDATQALRLNQLLEKILLGANSAASLSSRYPAADANGRTQRRSDQSNTSSPSLRHLEEIQAPERPLDF